MATVTHQQDTKSSISFDTRLSLPVEGMTCASCVGRVEAALKAIHGVEGANVNLATEKAEITLTAPVAREVLAKAVREAGYDVPKASIDLAITGMTCEHCVKAVTDEVSEIPGVTVIGPPDTVARAAELLEAALARGVATFCEKPVAGTIGEAVRMLVDGGAKVVVGTCPDIGVVQAIRQPLRSVIRRYGLQLAARQRAHVLAAGGHPVDDDVADLPRHLVEDLVGAGLRRGGRRRRRRRADHRRPARQPGRRHVVLRRRRHCSAVFGAGDDRRAGQHLPHHRQRDP